MRIGEVRELLEHYGIEEHGLTHQWLGAYERALQKGVVPRERLRTTYRELQSLSVGKPPEGTAAEGSRGFGALSGES